MRKMALYFFLLIPPISQCSEGFQFKLANGMISFDSRTLSGSTLTYLSPSIGYYKDLSEQAKVNFDFSVFFSIPTKSVSLFSLGLTYNYIFSGSTKENKLSSSGIEFNQLDRYLLYIPIALKRYTYFLGSNKFDETRFDQNGDFYNFDLGIGGQFNLPDNKSYFAELTGTILSLASSDDRVKYRTILFSFGLRY